MFVFQKCYLLLFKSAICCILETLFVVFKRVICCISEQISTYIIRLDLYINDI